MAGWIIGAATFLCALHLVGDAPQPRPWRGAGAALLAAGAAFRLVEAAPLNHWLVRVALALSGNPSPYPWGHCG
jgi:hypothetical protein